MAPFSDGPVKAHKTQGYFGKAVGLETRLLHDCSKQLLPLGTINYVIPGASLLSLLPYTANRPQLNSTQSCYQLRWYVGM